MAEAQALTRGTRVEITDLGHAGYGEQAELRCKVGGGLWMVKLTETAVGFHLKPNQFRVTEQPEPTVGQLVDAMHQEIERVCERMGWILLAVDLQSGFNPSKHQASIQILGRGWIDCTGDTPQAALRAMIERLREIKA
jgi:hypothetical protein